MDLWTEASRDVEAEDRLRAYARATAAIQPMWSFFALAQSPSELEHRKALARESLERIAAESGIPLADVAEIIDRSYRLLSEARLAKQAAEEEEEGGQWTVVDKNTGAKVAGPFGDREKAEEALKDNDSGLPSSELEIEHESAEPEEEGEEGEGKEASRRTALTEGENVLAETVNDASGRFPASVEKLPEHNEGPDENIPPEAYSRVSMPQPGDSGASNPEPLAPMSEREARRIMQLALTGNRKTAIGEYVDPSQQMPIPPAPSATTGLETGVPPEGQPPSLNDASDPLAGSSYPMTTKPRQMPGGGGMGGDIDAGGADPVSDQIDQVTSAIRRDNPTISAGLARRVARKAVARMLTAAGDDGIDYTHNEIPKPKPVGGGDEDDENEGNLAGHAAETAGTMTLTRAAPAIMEALPLLAL